MAEMVKEKSRDKKKSKEKRTSRSHSEGEQSSFLADKNIILQVENQSEIANNESNIKETIIEETEAPIHRQNYDPEQNLADNSVIEDAASSSCIDLNNKSNILDRDKEQNKQEHSENVMTIDNSEISQEQSDAIQNVVLEASNISDTYASLNSRLERVFMPNFQLDQTVVENQVESLNISQATEVPMLEQCEEQKEIVFESVLPSAPIFQEVSHAPQYIEYREEITKEVLPKQQCMLLEDAARLFGGKEMAEVRAMSEREEAIVEAGPMSGPEHPLVDLLSTFRTSLIAVERERSNLSTSFIEEERFRNSLWKKEIERRTMYTSEICKCGQTVELKAVFEQAEFLRGKLPAAKMRLERLLRDVQESFCHHQHEALLAHCQIEELISETVQSSKKEIREALALILQALRMSDNAPSALATSLQRWATALSEALVDGRDLRQLLHLLHQLFKQRRSVRWAARVIRLNVVDRSGAARLVATLDLLLANPKLESAVECTEETDDAWEEVDKRGGAGAVSEGSLRERDLLALLHAFPLKDLVAKLALFARSDITQTRATEWGDTTHGHDVLRACCGVRLLLSIIHKAVVTHTQYGRLRSVLQRLASDVLHALAGLHLQCSDSYNKDTQARLQVELEAAFAAGLAICASASLHSVPATLLSDGAAMEYCGATIAQLHESTPSYLECLRTDVPPAACGARVRAVAQAAIDRTLDHDLAARILDFLMQCGVKRKAIPCKGTCDVTAREMLPKLLTAHPYLHTMAFHMLADISQVESLDTSSVKAISPELWRPSTGEAKAILDDWARRCVHLLPSLLIEMDYTPYCGVSLETQTTIGFWLCYWSSQAPPTPEWAWRVLRKLRTHRVWWALPLEAPPSVDDVKDVFTAAFAVLATDWGHCIPLICSQGVAALRRVAATRPLDAAHCLSPLVMVMSTSPESISLTPQFKELFNTLLESGPTLVQRALGLGPQPGADLLLKLILTHLDGKRPAVIARGALTTAWLHALGTHAAMDTALLAAREWTQLDVWVTGLMQEENAKEHVAQAVRNAYQAPLICECVLRVAHGQREATLLWPRLLDILHMQRIAGDKIHVDNALKHIGAAMSAEELIINKASASVLAAPLQHPAHLPLWRLFFHLYLQRPPQAIHESTPPCGPLFFSGLFKSRSLGYLKTRLQETITYHHNEAEALKSAAKQIPSPHEPTTSKQVKSSKDNAKTEELLPALSLRDLTGESSDSDSESSEDSEEEKEIEVVAGVTEKDVHQLFCYHVAAEKMFREYSRWLEEGDKARAMPHHADIARFIPEQALDAAWSAELARRRPPPSPEDEEFPLPPSAPPPRQPSPSTPLNTTVKRILKIKDNSLRRSRKPVIKSPLENVNFTDIRQLTQLVEKHLADMEKLAQEWSSEVSRIASLDSRLWELVCVLRIKRPLPAVPKQCTKKCKPIQMRIQADEWCISTGAQQGIAENRAGARASLRRVARARPHAARTAAALHAIARRIRNKESAIRVCERAWRSAGCGGGGGAPACPLVAAALTQLVTDLAEKWLCQDGRLCADLLSQWSNSASTALHSAMCGALVSPRRMRAEDCARVYTAVLRANLPPDAAFSYLSKFEMARWSQSMDPAQRRDILQALLSAAQRRGVKPDAEHDVLLELIGVHAATVLDRVEICAYIASCARAAVAERLPPAHWAHVATAVARHASFVPFDQLGHLFRDLGITWWEARTKLKGARTAVNYEIYAKEISELLRELQRAFVAAAVAMSYTPDRVALYAWSTLQESWAPWITPRAALPPLLSSLSDQEAYTQALQAFVDTIRLVMTDCPGAEAQLFQQIFEWAIQTHLATSSAASQECRVQVSALLAALGELPWAACQWLAWGPVRAALQICTSSDKELHAWCSEALRGITAQTFAQVCDADDCAVRLAALLTLFTSVTLAQSTLNEATRLPWWRLPEAALDEALVGFFMQYHSPAQPYHELQQFRVLLFAGELCLYPDTLHFQTRASRDKRAHLTSAWVRAAAQPALASHVKGHTGQLLAAITDVAPYLEHSPGEVEEILSRAVIIMCMEPAASAALPVWQSWALSTTARMASACVSAVAVLTAFEHFAALADSAAKALLSHADSGGWNEIMHRWQSCPWREAAPLISRSRLCAAYAAARTHSQTPDDVRAAVLALMNTSINFAENEAIIAVWICYACRLALATGDTGELEECRAVCRTLVAKWAEEPRRSLLKVVTMQQDTATPTAQHRILCRFAQCIIAPSDISARAYETACAAVLGSASDVLGWGKTPSRKRLPRLATRLYPSFEKYFKDELDLAPEA